MLPKVAVIAALVLASVSCAENREQTYVVSKKEAHELLAQATANIDMSQTPAQVIAIHALDCFVQVCERDVEKPTWMGVIRKIVLFTHDEKVSGFSIGYQTGRYDAAIDLLNGLFGTHEVDLKETMGMSTHTRTWSHEGKKYHLIRYSGTDFHGRPMDPNFHIMVLRAGPEGEAVGAEKAGPSEEG